MRDLSNLKLCFIAGTLEHGGAERQLFYMLRALCHAGASPRVLCFDQGEFWEEAIRSLGVPLTWVGQQNSRLARLMRVMRELRKEPPDVLQSQHFFANAYVGLSSAFLHLGGIGAMRNEAELELRENGPVGGWLNLHLPRLIAANSKRAIQQAIERGIASSRLYFLPNVVETERFKPASGPTDHPLTLLGVGRLVKTKRFDRFISLLARLRRRSQLNIRGVIAGPAQDEGLHEALEAQAVSLGLYPDSLGFIGSVSDIAPLYREADICVLTSDFEGTPNVLLEAMASGLPVVGTNVGGVADIIQHGKTGFVLDPDDLDGMVAALVQLAINAPLRRQMGERARRYVEEEHSVHRLPVYLGNLYDQALSPRRQSKPSLVESPAA